MGRITDIKPQQRDKSRRSIFVDGEYCCGVGDIVIAQKRIKIGQEISVAELKELVREEEERSAFDRALTYLTYRPRTRKELTKYLTDKGFETEIISVTLSKLERYRYVDDAAFGRQWVDERSRQVNRGARMIRQELKQKGLSEEEVAAAMDRVDPELELEKAVKLAEKYARRCEGEPVYKRRGKMSQALARRGYEWDVIEQAVNRVLSEEE